ncbi:MAG: hypothetical protein HY813_00125 [Candidatus Portnoybacteria bacterium]|nr:hypothetical protein [Candidatus Portnoybacteria bacterium]
MPKKFYIFITILIIAGSFLLVHQIIAQNQETAGTANIQYPIKELDDCENKKVCKAYCDKSEHTEDCLDFAEKNNLMSKNEIATAKKFVAAGNKGPGGCEGKDGCESYCNDMDHMDECIAFAEKNNIIPPKELAEAKKVQAAIKRGVKPPPCKNKKACDAYCEDPDHMEECIVFGTEAGFIQGKELEDSQKMLVAFKKGVKPPPCRGKTECDKYCQDPDHMEVCMNFAIEAGFMTEEQKADSQKMLAALKKGVKPPACQGKEDCDKYCGQDEHFEECTNFAEAAGFMTAEQTTMARKTGGKGPGGCKGKDACEAFCNNPDNQETCFNFAKENGMIPEEDLKRMEEGKRQFKESLNQTPSEVMGCLNSSFSPEMMEKFKSGAAMPPKEIGDQMRQCFEKVMPQPPPGSENGMMPANQPGPGGCKTQEECKTYCQTNPDACKNFQPLQTGSGGTPTPGTNPMPCAGTNCPPPPEGQQYGPQYQPQYGPQYQMQPGKQIPSTGMPSQPGEFVHPPEGYVAPSPPTSGGMTPGTPGTYTPPAEPPPPTTSAGNEPGSIWKTLLKMIGF